MMRLGGALALGVLASAVAHAEYELVDTALQKRTDAVLAVMGYTVVPDLTTSTLSISSTDTGNPQMTMSQLAGGFTISQNTPLYLEGGAAYSRYDPSFVVSDGTDTREVPLKWTRVMLTGGVGWDFPVIDKLKFRPIANFAYGHHLPHAAGVPLSVWRGCGGNSRGVCREFLKRGAWERPASCSALRIS